MNNFPINLADTRDLFGPPMSLCQKVYTHSHKMHEGIKFEPMNQFSLNLTHCKDRFEPRLNPVVDRVEERRST